MKLKAELGGDGVDVEVEHPEFLEVVSDAVASGENLNITYWSPASNDESARTIHPLSVFSDMGHWYVTANDSKRGAHVQFPYRPHPLGGTHLQRSHPSP